MSDLQAEIRRRLAAFENEACYGGGCECGSRCSVYKFEEMRDTLLVVLDVHDPHHRMQATDTGEWLAVDDCREAPFSVAGLLVCTFADGERAEERYVPCPTTLAIAEKLGIEVGGDG